MKRATKAWLDAAKDDLSVIEEILSRPDLTNIVAFHAQQCVEKVLKALIEERGRPVRRTHSLVQLMGIVSEMYEHFSDDDTTTPNLLDQLYTDSRYPNEFGLLPDGKPTIDEAVHFSEFAHGIHDQCLELLQ